MYYICINNTACSVRSQGAGGRKSLRAKCSSGKYGSASVWRTNRFFLQIKLSLKRQKEQNHV
ncbi:MAG TPA: hypothetical protein DCL73_07125 [Treponema sp.]|nr:hypothetical protein [Treponema sp.]